MNDSTVTTPASSFEISEDGGAPAICFWIGRQDAFFVQTAESAREAAFKLFEAADALDTRNGIDKTYERTEAPADLIDGTPAGYDEIRIPWSGEHVIFLDPTPEGSWRIDVSDARGPVDVAAARVMVQEIISAVNLAQRLGENAH
ncbi:hypothetical protein [Frigoribacterium sp. UYMn621]|uniref:hypothetical protein n=1 Tax=Frigoribacterium sp. UYMn621 TaxID=3156343 RepID=UPI003390D841